MFGSVYDVVRESELCTELNRTEILDLIFLSCPYGVLLDGFSLWYFDTFCGQRGECENGGWVTTHGFTEVCMLTMHCIVLP